MKTIPHFTVDMPIEIDVNEKGLTVYPVVAQKRKLLLFKESELLKGLSAKKAHAEELADIQSREFGDNE